VLHALSVRSRSGFDLLTKWIAAAKTFLVRRNEKTKRGEEKKERPARTGMPKRYIGQPVGFYLGTSSYPSVFSLHPALHGGGSEISPTNKAKQANGANARKVPGMRTAATTCEAPNQQGKGCRVPVRNIIRCLSIYLLLLHCIAQHLHYLLMPVSWCRL
jgi:hypothetical protein